MIGEILAAGLVVGFWLFTYGVFVKKDSCKCMYEDSEY